MLNLPLRPEQASSVSNPVDQLFLALVVFSLILTVTILLGMAYLAVRYRRGSTADRSRPLRDHPAVETSFAIAMLAVGMGIFYWGATLYFDIKRPADQHLEMYVLGKQWMWHIYHPEGKAEINELHVPMGQPVTLTMISQDVIHSFYIPAFRIKQDVLPGRYTTLSFQATKTGRFHLFCAEYCGTEHSRMIGSVVVMEPADYQRWLTGAGDSTRPETMAEAGERHFQVLGCVSCHMAGDNQRGPSLQELYGGRVQLASGETITADEDYLRESILKPAAQLVAGYDALMPTYDTMIGEKELLELVDYIKSLAGDGKE